MADPGIAGVQRRRRGTSVEPVDRLHQVEDRVAEHRRVLAHRDQPRVWNVGAGQRVQHLVSRRITLLLTGRRCLGPRRNTYSRSDRVNRNMMFWVPPTISETFSTGPQTLLRHQAATEVRYSTPVKLPYGWLGQSLRPRQPGVDGVEDITDHRAQRDRQDRRPGGARLDTPMFAPDAAWLTDSKLSAPGTSDQNAESIITIADGAVFTRAATIEGHHQDGADESGVRRGHHRPGQALPHQGHRDRGDDPGQRPPGCGQVDVGPIATTTIATYSDHPPICADGLCGYTSPGDLHPRATPNTNSASWAIP